MSRSPGSTPPELPDPALGRAVGRLRAEQGLGQEELAQRSGVAAAYLAQVESGEVDPPWTTVAAIAEVLGVSMESLAKAAIAEDGEAP